MTEYKILMNLKKILDANIQFKEKTKLSTTTNYKLWKISKIIEIIKQKMIINLTRVALIRLRRLRVIKM